MDLRVHNTAGEYAIHVYGYRGSVYKQIGQKICYVEQATASPIRADVSADSKTLTISYTNPAQYEHVHFAVWSEADGQDDLRWYPAQSNGEGEWTCAADLRDHNSAGTYHIHGYSITDGVYTKLVEYTVHAA